jgi:Spy/CpxP family protein refolding chaperone
MQKFKSNSILLAAATLVFFSGAVSAPLLARSASQAGFQEMDDDRWVNCLKERFESKLFKAISASEEQKTSLAKLVDETIETNKPLRSELSEKAIALTEGMADTNMTDEQLRGIWNEVRSLRVKISENREESLLKARAILNTKQRKILASRVEALIKRFQPGHFFNQDSLEH